MYYKMHCSFLYFSCPILTLVGPPMPRSRDTYASEAINSFNKIEFFTAQPVDRILDAAVRQLQEIRRGARANGDVGEELRRALPTLQRRRDRGRARDPGDRRRYADVRVRFTALDGPGYTSTNHIKHEDLLAKGLGK